ncbi:MAG: YbgC/FadM family acyl-CoA thioesterase [Planktomarina sp.]|nr:YbgC/FadM family acyl-CoA thioesterase [Planktomarina sp.]
MAHIFNFKIYYEDTDMGGIVYYANYFKFIERARSNLVAGIGIDQLELRTTGVTFVVQNVSAEYLEPARMDDNLRVETTVLGGSPVRWILQQDIWRKQELIFKAKVTIVLVGSNGKPIRLLAKLRRPTLQ